MDVDPSNDPPSWAATPAPKPRPVPPEQEPRSGRATPLVLAFLGGVLLTGLVVGAFFLGRSSNSTTAAEDDPADDTTVVVTEPTTTTEPPPQIESSSTSVAEEVDPPEDDVDDTEPAADADASQVETTEGVDGNRVARLRGGVLTLEGAVPSEEISAEIAARAAAILGEENVINDYVIDPDIAYADSGPLVVEDLILFPTGSSQINPAFAPLLDLGTNLLTQFPTVTITVIAHTDAVGPAEENLALSQARGNAVAAYWIERGVDPARITIDARGETELLVPVEGAEPTNRRAEFIITGLLG